jgi:hypothetical protein
MELKHSLALVPDDELLRRLAALLRQTRRTEADLVAHIGEVDSRRLYAREASPSMFAYCTERLHLSEAEAYLRIAAARASREHPALLTMLADGRLHLTAIAKLAPHLTSENRESLLERATHKTKREIEELVAAVTPRPDVPDLVRRLPERRRTAPATAAFAPELRLDAVVSSRAAPRPDGVASSEPERHPARTLPDTELRLDGVEEPGTVQPLAPGRYRVQFTASAELRDKLERLRALMRGSVHDDDLAAVVEAAVTEKLERLEARRFGRTKSPRKRISGSPTTPGSRHIPAAVRRAVHERDGGRCRFVDEEGRRCSARDGLEFHHRHPFGLGGDHSPDGLSLVCRTHNQHLAEADYGRRAMARHRRSGTGSPGIPREV